MDLLRFSHPRTISYHPTSESINYYIRSSFPYRTFIASRLFPEVPSAPQEKICSNTIYQTFSDLTRTRVLDKMSNVYWPMSALPLLLRLYVKHKVLWHPRYSDRCYPNAKERAYAEIAWKLRRIVPGVTRRDVKKKLIAARSQFVRLVHEIEKAKRKGYDFIPSYEVLWLYDCGMAAMADYMVQRHQEETESSDDEEEGNHNGATGHGMEASSYEESNDFERIGQIYK